MCAALSTDCRRLLAGCVGGDLHLRNLATGEITPLLPKHRADIIFCDFSPDGSQVLSIDEKGKAVLWDSHTGKAQRSFQVQSRIFSADVSFNNGRILTGGANGTLCLWDMRTGQRLAVLSGNVKAVTHVTISPDATRGVSVQGTHAFFWNLESGALIMNRNVGLCGGFVFLPNGKKLVSWAPGDVRVWEPDRGHVKRAGFKFGWFSQVHVANDGNLLLIADDGKPASIGLWRLEKRQPFARFSGHRGGVITLRLSPRGERLFVVESDHVYIWNMKRGAGRFVGALLLTIGVLSLAIGVQVRRRRKRKAGGQGESPIKTPSATNKEL